jgi:hypothetical protein
MALRNLFSHSMIALGLTLRAALPANDASMPAKLDGLPRLSLAGVCLAGVSE